LHNQPVVIATGSTLYYCTTRLGFPPSTWSRSSCSPAAELRYSLLLLPFHLGVVVAPKFAAAEEPLVHHIDALLCREGRAELDDDYTSENTSAAERPPTLRFISSAQEKIPAYSRTVLLVAVQCQGAQAHHRTVPSRF
jgi:hypothetical protein